MPERDDEFDDVFDEELNPDQLMFGMGDDDDDIFKASDNDDFPDDEQDINNEIQAQRRRFGSLSTSPRALDSMGKPDADAAALSPTSSADLLTERDRSSSEATDLSAAPLSSRPVDINKAEEYSLAQLLTQNSSLIYCGCPESGRRLERQALGHLVVEQDQQDQKNAQSDGATQTFNGPSHRN